MEFGILGPLEVREGDRVLALPRPKQRALLACLLLRAGEVVSVGQLYEDLWGEQVPATARASLQNFVSQVRRELGADVIEKRPPGYRLAADPDCVDLVRFERLLAGAARPGGPGGGGPPPRPRPRWGAPRRWPTCATSRSRCGRPSGWRSWPSPRARTSST